jgi:2,4-dienoyl-CoA reductase-like NADH-dependent reductase (Old Yellow Enzyme family)/thioredoxin reductase
MNMEELKYKRLFEPIRLGNTLFRNRVFGAPTGYQNMTKDGIVGADAAFYYERKAMGGAAAVTVGECVVDSALGKGALFHICLDNPFALHGLADIAGAIRRQGAVASAELQHAGMFANRRTAEPGPAYGPVECDDDGRQVFEMTEEIIARTIEKYAAAAAFAKQCGFGMVTIHGGHGWLISQFLSPTLNTRKDKWGGAPIENRARIAVAICDAVRKAVGPGFPIEIRISGSECYAGGYGIDEGVAFAKQLDGHVDLIHVSAGSHEVEEVFTVTHPSMFLPDGVNVQYAAEVKKHVRTPVATVGALSDPALMEDILASGKADVVEVARGLLADPDLPRKARAGKEDEIRKCMRCLACFSELMKVGRFYCAINPESGREAEMRFSLPPARKKRVLVAGGGVAGMQAALTCAKRGHEVVLCEKSERLGGILLCEEDVPFKQGLTRYIGLQSKLLAKAGVDVRLGTPVTAAYAADIGADTVVAALGARPLVPAIDGVDGANVLSAEEAYRNPASVGKTVVILGAGLVGAELAILLSMRGKKVRVAEMLGELNDGGNFMHAKALAVEIARYAIEINFFAKAVRIDAGGVLCETPNGELYLAADTVIYALGQRPLQEEAVALGRGAREFYLIGDCVSPKNIMEATATAHAIARNIGGI